MRSSFLILLTLLTLSATCQTTPTDTLDVLPTGSVVPNGVRKLKLDLTAVINANATVQAQSKSINGISDTCRANVIQITAIKKQVSSDSSLLQGAIKQIAATQLNVAQNTADIAALQQGGGGGVAQPYIISASATLPTLPNNTDIWIKCSGCTVTLITAQAGWHYRLHNIGSGVVNIRTGLNTPINSVSQMAKGSRPFDATWLAAGTVEVH